MWLFLLKDTAERERQQSQQATTPAQQQRALEHTALYYGWAMQAASRFFPKLLPFTKSGQTEAEMCLIKALECYHLLNDRQSARLLALHYRNARQSDWQLTPALEQVWPGIFDEEPEEKKKRGRRK